MKRFGIVRQALVVVMAAAIAAGVSTAPARADSDDTWVAVAGVAALALIAAQARKERKRKERAAQAAAQSARNAIESRLRENRVCTSPVWNGNVWVENDGSPCLPTPRVCLMEKWRGDFLVKFYDYGCMQREGFRLSAGY